jgi:hypothetical protein
LKYLFRVVTLPAGVCTLMVALTAPVGTVASIVLSLATENVAASTPKSTFVVPVNPLPLMTTGVPTGPLVGEKPVTVTPAARAETGDDESQPAAPRATRHRLASHRLGNLRRCDATPIPLATCYRAPVSSFLCEFARA